MRRMGGPSATAPSLFDDEDERYARMSEAELVAEAQRLEALHSRILRILRAKKGAAATRGKARRRRISDDRIVEVYLRHGGGGEQPVYGALKQTWTELGLSERQVSRRLRAKGLSSPRLAPPGNPTGFNRKGEKLKDQPVRSRS